MATQTLNTIKEALDARQEVVGTYDGRPRAFLPFIVGYDKDGDEQVSCYQTGGQSSSGLAARGSPANWRLLTLSKLRVTETRDVEWFTPDSYNPDDPKFDQIVARVPR